MSSPVFFEKDHSTLTMFSIPPAHSPSLATPPSLDDRSVPRITIPRLPFPVTPPQSIIKLEPLNSTLSLSPTSSYASSYLSSPSAPSTPSSTPKRIARPPNAFMLFRSAFLKKGIIPTHVESRQQNLSRIIGETWRTMEEHEKQPWVERSKEAAKRHKRMYPDYKFFPSPRGSRAAKNKANTDGKLSDEQISRLREKYTYAKGPAPPSNKNRRPKRSRSVEVGNRGRSYARYPITKVDNANNPPSSSSPRPSQIPSSMQTISPMTMHSQTALPHHPSSTTGFYSEKDTPSFSFEISLGENPDQPVFDQTMFDLLPQHSENLDNMSFAVPHCNPGFWATPSHLEAMEVISPPILPQKEADAPRTRSTFIDVLKHLQTLPELPAAIPEPRTPIEFEFNQLSDKPTSDEEAASIGNHLPQHAADHFLEEYHNEFLLLNNDNFTYWDPTTLQLDDLELEIKVGDYNLKWLDKVYV